MTATERDVAEEDYEARKDDVAARSGRLAGGAVTPSRLRRRARRSGGGHA